MQRRMAGFGLMLAALAGAAGCGDDGESVSCSTDASAGPPERRIVELSASERADLCDWGVCQVGGYGARPVCPNGISLTIARDRRRCLDQTPTNPACQATVNDYARCMAAVRASPCAETLFLGSECAPLTSNECVVFTPTASLGTMPINQTFSRAPGSARPR